MSNKKALNYIEAVLENMPSDWVKLTTHRLDIYNEKLAKVEFVTALEQLFQANNSEKEALKELPTAYDYIRLGHPLSCVLEWTIAKLNGLKTQNVISFSSQTTPILAILRKNLFDNKKTKIVYIKDLPDFFDAEIIHKVYGYNLELQQIQNIDEVSKFDGTVVFVAQPTEITSINTNDNIDFIINLNSDFGSILIANGEANETYISDIQHVRRRETIAMTPTDCLTVLKNLVGQVSADEVNNFEANKTLVLENIKTITGSETKALLGSSGLSIQYAIMMGLVHDAIENHPKKAIKFVVPPNCYGGTNDQARRVAACLNNVEIVDLPVDGDNDMVRSVDIVLEQLAKENAIPYIIAEIPTNPRVEVPELVALQKALSKERKTNNGEVAIAPVFILDQTFCPNYEFLGEGKILSTIQAISYASGSKFPSGGLCTAGYCIGNTKTNRLMDKIELHLNLCDNAATKLQTEILAKQLPSMNQRIAAAYKNTRDFVDFIQANLPEAKINFVSKELANQGFTPSVFSLGLPTKGETAAEQEAYKRALNLKLINLMITKIPNESKYCVSYGQLKGCYWTIPATSTQGTTKEGDKDYIVRASLSANMDLDLHKAVFMEFVEGI